MFSALELCSVLGDIINALYNVCALGDIQCTEGISLVHWGCSVH